MFAPAETAGRPIPIPNADQHYKTRSTEGVACCSRVSCKAEQREATTTQSTHREIHMNSPFTETQNGRRCVSIQTNPPGSLDTWNPPPKEKRPQIGCWSERKRCRRENTGAEKFQMLAGRFGTYVFRRAIRPRNRLCLLGLQWAILLPQHGEAWLRRDEYKLWAHCECAELENQPKQFTCGVWKWERDVKGRTLCDHFYDIKTYA